jgi:hypothetical protein
MILHALGHVTRGAQSASVTHLKRKTNKGSFNSEMLSKIPSIGMQLLHRHATDTEHQSNV